MGMTGYLTGKITIIEESLHPLNEASGIQRITEEARGDSIDQIGDPTDLGGHDRYSNCLCLQHDHGAIILMGRESKQARANQS
jgi:hypothetical protein